MYKTYGIVLSLLLVGLVGAVPTANGEHRGRATPSEGAVAQPDTVRGTVTDAGDRMPLPGVNIRVGGTSQGTVTDASGRYVLDVAAGADSLIFSFVGYQTARVPIRERTVIDVRLEPATYVGEELVVIGYGTQQRRDVTGSVSSLQVEDLEQQGPSYSVEQLLQGKVPGLRAVFSGGQPGSGASISIRGASSISAGTSPLFVVDGLPSNVPPNPSDIESIEVLKDASATAIYGARGANGVVLITTKRGRQGDLQVSYTGEVGAQTISNKLDLLTPQEYQRVLNDIIEDGGGNAEQRVENVPNGGTDWQDQVLRTAAVQNHDLSFSGGTGETQYYVSLGAFFQDGIIIDSGFERYMARVNLDHEITNTFNFGVRLNALYRKDDFVPNNFGVNENAGALYAAYNFDPTLPVRDENGDYSLSPFITTDNPMALAYGERRAAQSYRTYGTVFAEYVVLPSLSAKLQVGADLFSTRDDVYITRLTKNGRANNGVADIDNVLRRDVLVEGTVTYDKSFGVHDVNAVTGITAQKFINENTSVSGQDFPSDATGTDNLGLSNSEFDDNNSFTASNQLLSYIGRVNYTLMDRYLLTATMRVDGSSRFGANNRFGYFPSAALAWRAHQEAFVEDLDLFSTLKLRASWGRTGNQAIGNYQSLTTFSPGPAVIFDDQQTTTTNPARLGNSDLQWETTEQIDVGFDFGFLRDRLYGSLDYFQKDTYDMLLQLPVPSSTGFNTQLTNIGSIKNTGWEFALESRNLVGDFGWTTNLNLATLNNEVESLGPVEEIITGGAGFTNQIALIQPGLPLRTYYGYEVEGVWQEGDDFSQTLDNVNPGDLKFRDVDGDSTVTAEDRVPLGNSFPDLTWSVGNTFSYEGLSLYVFVQGVHGVQMLNNNLVDTYFPINFRRNKFAEPYLNRWTSENPSDTYPSFVTPLSQGQKPVNSYTVQDASYIRLQTVRLSYTLPPVTSAVRSLTVYATAENVFTLTDYDGVDPAVNPNNSANFRIDYNVYPSTTTYTLGLRLGL